MSIMCMCVKCHTQRLWEIRRVLLQFIQTVTFYVEHNVVRCKWHRWCMRRTAMAKLQAISQNWKSYKWKYNRQLCEAIFEEIRLSTEQGRQTEGDEKDFGISEKISVVLRRHNLFTFLWNSLEITPIMTLVILFLTNSFRAADFSNRIYSQSLKTIQKVNLVFQLQYVYANASFTNKQPLKLVCSILLFWILYSIILSIFSLVIETTKEDRYAVLVWNETGSFFPQISPLKEIIFVHNFLGEDFLTHLSGRRPA